MMDSMEGGDVNSQLGALVLQMLHQQTQKTCFKKCFLTPQKFADSLGKSEHVCLAKCMDRMYESYAIVTKASTEMAQNITASPDASAGQSYSFQ